MAINMVLKSTGKGICTDWKCRLNVLKKMQPCEHCKMRKKTRLSECMLWETNILDLILMKTHPAGAERERDQAGEWGEYRRTSVDQLEANWGCTSIHLALTGIATRKYVAKDYTWPTGAVECSFCTTKMS